MTRRRIDARPGADEASVIGITGGFGSGKTTVASIVRQLGYTVLETDGIARRVMKEDASVRSALAKSFGESVFDARGNIRRHHLASIVFSDPQRLNDLNAIVHPPVIRQVGSDIASCAKKGEWLIFVESALIYEAEIEDMFDYIIAVVARESVVENRIMIRDRSTIEQVRARTSNQLPQDEKAALADFTIRNDGTLLDLERTTLFIVRLIERLCRPS